MALTVLLMVGCLPHEASALGRLFFTPRERLELERQVKVPPDSSPRSHRRLKVNGWLSGGTGTRLWVDGHLSGVMKNLPSAKLVNETLRILWQGRWLKLKPGQVARMNSQGRFHIHEFDHDSD